MTNSINYVYDILEKRTNKHIAFAKPIQCCSDVAGELHLMPDRILWPHEKAVLCVRVGNNVYPLLYDSNFMH